MVRILAPDAERSPAAEETRIVSWQGSDRSTLLDTLAAEEPLEIRLAGCSVAITMRTPGDDVDLALGFLFTEGIIRGPEDVDSVAHCPPEVGPTRDGRQAEEPDGSNIVNVNPVDPALVTPERWQRNFYATSSCGLCGKASIDSVRQQAPSVASDARVSAQVLHCMERRLRDAQAVFGRTGGLHAAGLFDLDGRLVVAREDVGRHNAVDKVVGHALREHLLPLSAFVLMVSGRASFEITQKALMAGIPIVAAVSAPSTLAVELARASNMSLVGFLRSGRFNVYAGERRIR